VYTTSSIGIQNACFECGKTIGTHHESRSESGNNSHKKKRLEDEVQKVVLLYCGRCGNATYCSKECQKNAWPDHKVFCFEKKPLNIEKIKRTLAELFAQKIVKEDEFKEYYCVVWLQTDKNGVCEKDGHYVLAKKPCLVERSIHSTDEFKHGLYHLTAGKNNLYIIDVACLNTVHEVNIPGLSVDITINYNDPKYKGIYIFSP